MRKIIAIVDKDGQGIVDVNTQIEAENLVKEFDRDFIFVKPHKIIYLKEITREEYEK